jgi:HPt (histidine-containing phosphotransfer) domain-containing protein
MFQNSARASHLRILEELNRSEGFNNMAFVQLTTETSPATAIEILLQFHKSVCQAHDELALQRDLQKEDAVAKICHKLKGSAELLGFSGFSQSLSNIRAQMKQQPTEKEIFSQNLERLILSCDSLAAIIEQGLRSAEPLPSSE